MRRFVIWVGCCVLVALWILEAVGAAQTGKDVLAWAADAIAGSAAAVSGSALAKVAMVAVVAVVSLAAFWPFLQRFRIAQKCSWVASRFSPRWHAAKEHLEALTTRLDGLASALPVGTDFDTARSLLEQATKPTFCVLDSHAEWQAIAHDYLTRAFRSQLVRTFPWDDPPIDRNQPIDVIIKQAHARFAAQLIALDALRAMFVSGDVRRSFEPSEEDPLFPPVAR